ncbi:hypothetical protein P7K49_005159, partial [Saguinus oedipus]
LNGGLCLPGAPNIDQKGTQSHLLCTENCCTMPATRVTLATCRAPPLRISWP